MRCSECSSSDTWRPKVFGGAPSKQASINHGTYFFHAHEEGLLANDTNIHAGIRTTLSGMSDYDNDGYCGFEIVEARVIDTIGTEGIIKKIKDRVGLEKPVYLSIDIDTLDPACKLPLIPPTVKFVSRLMISFCDSCACNGYAGDWWLVDQGAEDHPPRPRRHQPRGRGPSRSCACL